MKTKLAWVPALLFLALVAVGVWRFSPSHNQGKPVGISVSAACLVPNWYVDPQNVSGCASDGNSCQSKTCSSGGVGPCLTYAQIASRWGSTSPLLSQNTTIDFLSAHNSKSDRVDFTPTLYNSGNEQTTSVIATVNAELPASTCTGTLASLTAKNNTLTTTAAMLAAQSACFTGTDLVVKNTTRSSQALTSQLRSGTTYSLTQPENATTFVEDDTWANGDSITVYAPQNVYFGTIGANSNAFNYLVLSNLSMYSPDGSTKDFVSVVGSSFVELEFGTSQASINDSSVGMGLFLATLQGSYNSETGSPSMRAAAVGTHGTGFPVFLRGYSANISDDTEWLDVGGLETFATRGSVITGGLYTDSAILTELGFVELAPSTSLYGPGGIYAGGRLLYNTTTAVSAFHLGGGIQCTNTSAPFGGATACSTTNPTGSGAAVTNCGILITPTALDTCPASSTAFCNFAWSPEGCLVGKGNF